MKHIAVLALAASLALPVYAQNIATVNGQAITQASFDQFVNILVKQGAQDSPQLRDQVKQEMINRLVAVQAAEKEGLTKDPEVLQETQLAKQSILVRALMDKYLADHPVTDEDIQKEYDTLKAEQADRKEYKLAHILVKDEPEAKKLIKELQAGKITFAEAAKKDSIDTGSGKNGGELGWGPTSNYVPEFAAAVEKMKKGDVSKTPVKTQFGYHIIDVEDTRPMTFPSLEEAKPQLEKMMRQQKLADYQKELMDSAKVVEASAADTSKTPESSDAPAAK